MILVSGNVTRMGIFAGTSNDSVVIDDGNFWRFEWLLLRDLQRQGQQYYMVIYYTLLVGN